MHVNPKQDYSDWKVHTYRFTYLAYEILCEPKSLNNKEKEGDNLSINHLINLIFLTTNAEKMYCVKILHMKRLYR